MKFVEDGGIAYVLLENLVKLMQGNEFNGLLLSYASLFC